jgi:hypothetical protein
MKSSATRKVLGILVLGLLIVLGVSSNANAQGRGRRASGLGKKCEKFVNCHDARDGRWDGRGPDRRLGTRRLIFRRNRRDRDDFTIRRGRFRNRDFQHDRYWRRHR